MHSGALNNNFVAYANIASSIHLPAFTTPAGYSQYLVFIAVNEHIRVNIYSDWTV
jgi:hypothetical protein